MSEEEILALEIKEEHLTALDNLGPAKARAVIEVAPLFGALVNADVKELAASVHGLSVKTAEQVINWVKGEYERLSSDPDGSASVGLATVFEEEDVLDGEALAGVIDPSVGPELGGLSVLESKTMQLPVKVVSPAPEGITEIRPRFDGKIVVRRG